MAVAFAIVVGCGACNFGPAPSTCSPAGASFACNCENGASGTAICTSTGATSCSCGGVDSGTIVDDAFDVSAPLDAPMDTPVANETAAPTDATSTSDVTAPPTDAMADDDAPVQGDG